MLSDRLNDWSKVAERSFISHFYGSDMCCAGADPAHDHDVGAGEVTGHHPPGPEQDRERRAQAAHRRRLPPEQGELISKVKRGYKLMTGFCVKD